MIGVGHDSGPERPPWLQSAAACVGIAGLVGLSIYVGFNYWLPIDPALAWLTVFFELVAFAGLGVSAWQWRRSRRHGAGAVLLTLVAAAWCGFTMFQKIEADTAKEALRIARERPQYVFASSAAQTAQSLLDERLRHPNPRPTCACPQTIASWEAAEAGAIDRLRNERDAAVAQMETALPEPERDWFALARGIGVEATKLFGFVCFVVMLVPARRRRSVVEPPAIPQPRQLFEVVEGGLSANASTIARPTRPADQPLRLGAWSALKAFGISALGATVAGSGQPAPQPPSTNSTTPANQPVETVVENTAAPIWRQDLGDEARRLAVEHMSERRIASQLTKRYGEPISRYQVRVWLGRERHAA